MNETFLVRYPKTKIRLRTLLVFPNRYELGIAGLGFQSVYHQLMMHPAVSCEWGFPDETGRLHCLESSSGLKDFDAVFFSFSFEPDLLNIVRILDLEGWNFEEANECFPFIVIGGIASAFTGQYLKRMADIVVSGDAYATIPPILEALLISQTRSEAINKLGSMPGIYPKEGITSRFLDYIRDENSPISYSVALSDRSEFPNRGLIEISQGCKYRCGFCLVSRVYGEYKCFSADSILETAERIRRHTDKLGLVAATLTNHPDFRRLIEELNRMGFQLSFSAFRAETLDDDLLARIIENENRTLVLAPETASAEIGKRIGKTIPKETIFRLVRKAVRLGLKRLKLYYMIGLPGEQWSDVEEIVKAVEEVRSIASEQAKEFGYIPELIVDVNPFTPKPLTALENERMEDIASLKKKVLYLKKNLRNLGRVFLYGESPKNAMLQYRISSGEATFGELLEWSRKRSGGVRGE